MENPFITYYDIGKAKRILFERDFNSDEEKKAFETIRHSLFDLSVYEKVLINLYTLLSNDKYEEAKQEMLKFMPQHFCTGFENAGDIDKILKGDKMLFSTKE